MSAAVETRSLTRRFGDIVAVDDLDLAVPQGCVFGFLGPNGAGKTTTIRMLLGLIRPDAGGIRILGHDVPESRKAVLQRVGALVEGPSLYGHLTGRENLEATRRLLDAPRRRIDEVLEVLDLTGVADRRVSGYSLGMRQRLALALALLPEPDLLILDEPTNGLDPAGIRETRGLLRDWAADRGATVLLSSHLLSEVEQTCTHVGILSDGRLLFQGPRHELADRLEPVVLVETVEPSRGVEVLAAMGLDAMVEGDRLRVEGVADEARAAVGNRRLVEAGVPVHRLELRRPTLEETFLQLTGERP